MADNYNIRLPDGTTVPLPAWARESTLRVLVDQMKIGGDLNNKLIKEVQSLNVDTDDLEQAIKTMFDRLEQVKQEETEIEKKSRLEYAKSFAKATTDIVDSFSDTSKPLTSAHAAAGKLAKGLAGGASEMFKDSKFMQNATQFAQTNMGQAANIIGDAAFAYAGFVAGQLENFAAVQQNMINAGAIFYDASVGFDDLRDMAVGTGITYKQLSEISNQYGTTLQVLGLGVSGGVTGFIEQFGALNEFADDFGDFGMSSEQMANAFIDYIDVERMTGRINNNTVLTTQQLQQGFSKLIMETTALASLTGMNRDELLAKQNAALRTPSTSAALIRLEKGGFTEEAEKFQEVTRQIASFSDFMVDGMAESLQLALDKGLGDAALRGDMASFDLRAALNAADPEGMLMPLLDRIGMIDDIEQAFSSDTPIEEINNMIAQSLAGAHESLSSIQVGSGDVLSAYAAKVKEMTDKSIIANESLQTLLTGTPEEQKALIESMKGKMNTAGQATVALNDLTRMFLEAQAALTVDLDYSADVARSLTGAMSRLAKMFDQQVQDENNDDGPPPVNSTPQAAGDNESFESILDELIGNGTEISDIPSVDSFGEKLPVQDFNQTILDNHRRVQGSESVTQQFDPIYGVDVFVLQGAGMNRTIMLPENYQPQQRFSGGDVKAGEAYVVGESRPGGLGEIFLPNVSGQIISNADATKILSNMIGGYSIMDVKNTLMPDVEQLISGVMGQLVSQNPQLAQDSTLNIVESTNVNNVNVQSTAPSLPPAPELIANIQSTVTSQTSSSIPQELIEKIEEEISLIAQTKQNLANAIGQYNREYKKYRRLAEQGRTIS